MGLIPLDLLVIHRDSQVNCLLYLRTPVLRGLDQVLSLELQWRLADSDWQSDTVAFADFFPMVVLYIGSKRVGNRDEIALNRWRKQFQHCFLFWSHSINVGVVAIQFIMRWDLNLICSFDFSFCRTTFRFERRNIKPMTSGPVGEVLAKMLAMQFELETSDRLFTLRVVANDLDSCGLSYIVLVFLKNNLGDAL